MAIFPALLCLLLQASGPGPSVTLSASAEQPYVGQEVTIQVDIFIPSATPPEPRPRLVLHWLNAEFGWTQQAEKWLEEQARPARGLALQINAEAVPVWAEHVQDDASPGVAPVQHYRLTRKLVAQPPDQITQGQIRLAPVKLAVQGKEYTSNPVTLTVRKVPPALRVLPRVNLGVGDYHLEMRVDPQDLELGGMTRLTLRVRGKGALQTVARPSPAQLAETLRTTDFVIELASEGWEEAGTVRCFHYHLQPRRAEITEVPRLPFTCFEPRRGDYVVRAAAPVPLRVRTPGPTATGTPSATVHSVLPDRLRLSGSPESVLRRQEVWPNFTVLLLLGILHPLVTGGLLLYQRRRLLEVWRHPRMRRSLHAARALAWLSRSTDHPPEDIAVVFLDYLRSRYPLAITEPTPAELAEQLQKFSAPPEVTGAVVGLWQEMCAARFAAAPIASRSLCQRTATVIRLLEGSV